MAVIIGNIHAPLSARMPSLDSYNYHMPVHRLLILLTLCITLLIACSPQRDTMGKIKHRQQLNVATLEGPTTYDQGSQGAFGLEYELTREFATSLGVKLNIRAYSSIEEVYEALQTGKADLAVGLTVTRERKRSFRFGPVYQTITPQLVYRVRNNSKRPRKPKDLIGKDIEIPALSSHVQNLIKLSQLHPNLTWNESMDLTSYDLMHQVWAQYIDYTVAYDIEIKSRQRFYPELAVAFDVGKPQSLAWALRDDFDDSLFSKLKPFFEQIEESGHLKSLLNEHYGHIKKFNYVSAQTLMRDITNRLPTYKEAFQKHARMNKLDWRLLAAVSYQESHWKADAVSPTGVRGLMMLTMDTAKFVGIKNRRDPFQSIEGGARYLRYMIDKMPKRIQDPDRTWLALAAYNVGYGHLEDARKITQWRKGNPDRWVDVKDSLPLLSKKEWYSRTRNGYARGKEPVGYVSNIRNYYDVLVWQDEKDTQTEIETPPEVRFGIDSLAL